MALIRCGACDSVHESTLAACPGCGRCPSCGAKRVDRRLLKEMRLCPECNVPYCPGCGRCHVCGKLRVFDLLPCTCGHPFDPSVLAKLEESFGVRA